MSRAKENEPAGVATVEYFKPRVGDGSREMRGCEEASRPPHSSSNPGQTAIDWSGGMLQGMDLHGDQEEGPRSRMDRAEEGSIQDRICQEYGDETSTQQGAAQSC